MAKRLISIITIIILMLSLVSCTGGDKLTNANGEVISPKREGDKNTLTILTSGIEYEIINGSRCFNEYVEGFEKNFGVDVEVVKLVEDANYFDKETKNAYMQKLSMKLLDDYGAELIFIEYISPEVLIEQGAGVDLKDKIKNLSKLYDELLKDQTCYIPIAMTYMGRFLDKDALQSIGVQDVNMDWNYKQYYDMWEKWFVGKTVYFCGLEYSSVFDRYFNFDNLYDKQSNTLKIDKAVIAKKINEARSFIFGGNYIIDKSYKYENYHNMIFEPTSKEYKESQVLKVKNLSSNRYLGGAYAGNLFNVKLVSMQEEGEQHWLMMPEFKDEIPYLGSYGFMVNKRGKNLGLSYEFINGLLEDEYQMKLYEENLKNDYNYSPVNKYIEDEIKAIEEEMSVSARTIQVKEYALQELKSGRCKLTRIEDDRHYELNGMLYKDFTKFILGDEPYSFEDLSLELKKLEDKYNIWLNE